MSDNKKLKQDELFRVVEYSADAAERIGYSNYSYWRSVWQNFLKNKPAVIMGTVFIFLVIFSFIALAIGKYQYSELLSDQNQSFLGPSAEYWFGTDNLGRDYWCQVWYAAQVSMAPPHVRVPHKAMAQSPYPFFRFFIFKLLTRYFYFAYHLLHKC